MAYLVLARKWRPQLFDDLIGQESIVKVLKNSLDQGKIAHAYLFSGPRGVGKTSTARILSKALNCAEGPTSHPCGACPFCVSIADGSSVDVMEIDGASNNSVNDIRDLRERVKYVPSAGKYKVYIIDETHMLSDAAFNALLKTLEEPPSHVVFVLATTAPKKIPSTVLSRCQHLPFRRIHSSLIKERLQKISDSEGITISGQALEMIARAADGSLRDSLTLLDQISSFSSDISESDVKDLLGITDMRLLSELALVLIEGKRDEILKITYDLVEKGTDIRTFMKELIQFFRDMLVASIVQKPEEILDLGSDELDMIKQILQKTSEDHLSLILTELLKSEIDIRNATSPRLAFEMALLKLSFLNDLRPLKEIIEQIVEGGGITQNKKSNPKMTEVTERTPKLAKPAKAEISNEVPLEDIPGEDLMDSSPAESIPGEHAENTGVEKILSEDIWERVMKKMEPPLASKLSKADHKLVGDRLILTLNGGYSVFADSVLKNKATIDHAFSDELGFKVRCELETAKKKTARKKDLKEAIIGDPAMKEVMELFDGRIVDIRQTTEKNE